MSDKPISVGDLVMVIKPSPCCQNSSLVGYVFTVGRIGGPRFFCRACRTKITSPSVADVLDDCAVLLERLKRIPPISELESTRTEETLKETA